MDQNKLQNLNKKTLTKTLRIIKREVLFVKIEIILLTLALKRQIKQKSTKYQHLHQELLKYQEILMKLMFKGKDYYLTIPRMN